MERRSELISKCLRLAVFFALAACTTHEQIDLNDERLAAATRNALQSPVSVISAAGDFSYISGKNVFLKREPSTESESIKSLNYLEFVKLQVASANCIVNGSTGKWHLVRTRDGYTGWVFAMHMEKVNDVMYQWFVSNEGPF